MGTIMVPHHMRNSFEIKKVHFYTWFPHGTQKWIFARNDESDALSTFGTQSWHSELSNGVPYAYIAHLEQKLFKFEISRFQNLAYFLHVNANFKPKRLKTIKNSRVFTSNILIKHYYYFASIITTLSTFLLPYPRFHYFIPVLTTLSTFLLLYPCFNYFIHLFTTLSTLLLLYLPFCYHIQVFTTVLH